jgi:hypothetical protein
VPLEPAVSAGGDTGAPVTLVAPDSDSGIAFRELADRVVNELLPPIEMSGCTARLFDLVAGID